MESYLKITLCPRAKQNTIVGWHGDSLKIRLTAPPVDGAANAALTKFLAGILNLPNRDVELISGLTSRQKRLRFSGLNNEELQKRLLDILPVS